MPEKMFFGPLMNPRKFVKVEVMTAWKRCGLEQKKQRMRAKEKKEIWQKHKKGFFYVLQP